MLLIDKHTRKQTQTYTYIGTQAHRHTNEQLIFAFSEALNL